MNSQKRNLYLLSSLVTIGLLLEIIVSINREGSYFESGLARGLNLFVYFTIWSNILVAITGLLYAKNSAIKNNAIKAMYLASLGAISVTFIVHRIFLAVPITGLPLLSDLIIHVFVPFLAIYLWFKQGDKKIFTKRILLLSTLFPNAWLLFTFIRGYLTNWYPYSFLNPVAEGFARVIFNVLAIYAIMYGSIFIYAQIERYNSSKK